jgi:hypothetical protein
MIGHVPVDDILAEAKRWRAISARMDWKAVHCRDVRLGGNYARRGLFAWRKALALEQAAQPKDRLIGRCPRCNKTAPMVRRFDMISGLDMVITDRHGENGECRGGAEIPARPDTAENRAALEAEWAGKSVCPSCCQRPVARRDLCASCADMKERPPLICALTRRRRAGGRR